MKASQWIDHVKTARNLPSDYAAAKLLGVSRQAVSDYRNKNGTMDEDAAVKVAEILGIDPVGIIIDQVAERSKSPEIASALHAAARRVCILCKVPHAAEFIASLVRPISAYVT